MALFAPKIIAIVWDFDKTLAPAYMQAPLFARYGVDMDTFWAEVTGLKAFYEEQGLTRVSADTLYLDHILQYVRNGTFFDLTNDVLRRLGAEIAFAPGVPAIFDHLKGIVDSDERFAENDIVVEHYVVSTGLAQMIKGSAIAPHIEDIWACEFVEQVAEAGYLQKAALNSLTLIDLPAEQRISKPIAGIGYHIDNTTKTRAVFEINKGVNKDSAISVNDTIAPADRRVPFDQMIYVADGPSDVPVFSVLKANGGKTYAVFDPDNDISYAQAKALNDQGRVDAFGEMNYLPKSAATRWLVSSVREIAERITQDRDDERERSVGKSPRHL